MFNMALETFDLLCPLTEIEKWLLSRYTAPYQGTSKNVLPSARDQRPAD